MPTSVALSNRFETLVRNLVNSGRYNNASEVVRAGLRLLEDRERANEAKLTKLRAAIAAGFASGPGLDAEPLFDRLEARYRTRARKKA